MTKKFANASSAPVNGPIPLHQLDLVVGDHPVFHCRQPQEIEQPEIAGEHIAPQWRERRKPSRPILRIVVRLKLVAGHIEYQAVAGCDDLDPIDLTKKRIACPCDSEGAWAAA